VSDNELRPAGVFKIKLTLPPRQTNTRKKRRSCSLGSMKFDRLASGTALSNRREYKLLDRREPSECLGVAVELPVIQLGPHRKIPDLVQFGLFHALDQCRKCEPLACVFSEVNRIP
jgi:hypothetical protein